MFQRPFGRNLQAYGSIMPQDKIYNLHLTRGQTAAAATGLYNAIVSLAHPEYRPSYMRILGQFSPGFMRAEIAYDAFAKARADAEVLAVELRALCAQPHTVQ